MSGSFCCEKFSCLAVSQIRLQVDAAERVKLVESASWAASLMRLTLKVRIEPLGILSLKASDEIPLQKAYPVLFSTGNMEDFASQSDQALRLRH